mmetsp:Transcript_3895/g.5801  ORF Transcript_3895/g.5801 Transcript_3895/m.5801 type:complete len:270 (+) Transcript_3895:527-1336(+)
MANYLMRLCCIILIILSTCCANNSLKSFEERSCLDDSFHQRCMLENKGSYEERKGPFLKLLAEDWKMKVGVYFYAPRDTIVQFQASVIKNLSGPKVASLSLVTLWLRGPLAATILGAFLTLISDVQNKDGSFKEESHKIYSEGEFFGSLLAGFLIGYITRRRLFSAIISTAIVSYVAAANRGVESDFVRFIGNGTLQIFKEILTLNEQYNVSEKMLRIVSMVTYHIMKMDENFGISSRVVAIALKFTEHIWKIEGDYHISEKVASILFK